jgi:ABC-2 type transport system permease protein
MTTMTERTVRPGPSAVWKAARLVPQSELARAGRIPAAIVMTAVQVALFNWLWHAAYAGRQTVASMDAQQVVTYSTAAILFSRIRWNAKTYSLDGVPNQVRTGSIVYWFVRPVTARRFHRLRASGEMLLGGTIALVGLLIAILAGIASPPPSAEVAVVSLVSAVLGQVISYYLATIVDLVCFWLTANNSASLLYNFVQDLMSGVFVPVWFFPGWLAGLAAVLPFQAIISTPLSFYVGRTPLTQVPLQLSLQLAWCVVLGLLVRALWAHASRRLEIQGG